jgi:predicted DNA-binding transcriptional regulator AlpA
MADDTKLWLSVKEVSRKTGLSTHTLNRWRGEGKGPPWIKLEGKLIAYPTDRFRDWWSGLTKELTR